MARTAQELIQDVLRETRGQATLYEARQAFQDALNLINGMARWEFLIATEMINLLPQVTTGTVACAAGSIDVTLTGGTWDPSTYIYPEIKFTSRSLQYKLRITSATTAVLDTPLSGTAGTDDITADAYILYQARYALPSDCEPGQDLDLKGPWQTGVYFDGNIPKRERMIFDHRHSEILTATFPMYYTDDEYDDSNLTATIRIEPYPRRFYEFRLTYYRSMTKTIFGPTISTSDPNNGVFGTILPETFERIPILIAASNILRKKNMQGWQTMRQEAGDMMNKMYNRYAASPAYEGKIDPSHADLVADDSDYAMDNMLFTRH